MQSVEEFTESLGGGGWSVCWADLQRGSCSELGIGILARTARKKEALGAKVNIRAQRHS